MPRIKKELDKNKRFQLRINLPIEYQEDFMEMSILHGFKYQSDFLRYCVEKVIKSHRKQMKGLKK